MQPAPKLQTACSQPGVRQPCPCAGLLHHRVPPVFAQLGMKGTGMRPAPSKRPRTAAARAERCKLLY